jgi:hypothetical protein
MGKRQWQHSPPFVIFSSILAYKAVSSRILQLSITRSALSNIIPKTHTTTSDIMAEVHVTPLLSNKATIGISLGLLFLAALMVLIGIVVLHARAAYKMEQIHQANVELNRPTSTFQDRTIQDLEAGLIRYYSTEDRSLNTAHNSVFDRSDLEDVDITEDSLVPPVLTPGMK